MPTVRQIRFVLKPVVFTAALLPLAGLVAGAFNVAGFRLGANPVEMIQDTTGIWALRLLLITLCMTPLRWATGKPGHSPSGACWGCSLSAMRRSTSPITWLLDRAPRCSTRSSRTSPKRPYIINRLLGSCLLITLARRHLHRRLAAPARASAGSKLHRAIYLIGILVCWHFWWQVKKDITEPLVYCAILAVLLGAGWASSEVVATLLVQRDIQTLGLLLGSDPKGGDAANQLQDQPGERRGPDERGARADELDSQLCEDAAVVGMTDPAATPAPNSPVRIVPSRMPPTPCTGKTSSESTPNERFM